MQKDKPSEAQRVIKPKEKVVAQENLPSTSKGKGKEKQQLVLKKTTASKAKGKEKEVILLNFIYSMHKLHLFNA